MIFFSSDNVILVKLYDTVMKISLKSHINPDVQIFHFLQLSYNTLISYVAKFLCNVCFHGRIFCMNTNIYMTDVLCMPIFFLCFPFKNLCYFYANSQYFNNFVKSWQICSMLCLPIGITLKYKLPHQQIPQHVGRCSKIFCSILKFINLTHLKYTCIIKFCIPSFH